MAAADLQFRIIGPQPDATEVPAQVLLQALESLQQLVWEFAFFQERRQFRQRLKFPAEFKDRFALRLAPAEPGSYILRARVGAADPDMVEPEFSGRVVSAVTRFSAAAVGGRIEELQQLLPDRSQRRRALETLRTLAPSPGSGYRFELQNSTGPSVPLTNSVQADLGRLLLPDDDDAAEPTQVVTGKLIEINFDDHNLSLLYPPTRRRLTCEYEEDVEPMLFENRRDLIQVRGKVRLGPDDHPAKIVEADYIGDLDLNPFILREVEVEGRRLRFRRPRRLDLKLDESLQNILLEDAELNLTAHAALRAELFEEVRTCLGMLWSEYAREDDAKLDPKSQALKQRLLRAIEEV